MTDTERDFYHPLKPDEQADQASQCAGETPASSADKWFGWELQLVVPDDAPELDSRELCPLKPPRKADHAYEYCNADGKLACKMLRWNTPRLKRKKQIRPATVWRNVETEEMKWRLKGHPGPLPLYSLGEILANPEKPLMFVEGEKDVHAGQALTKKS